MLLVGKCSGPLLEKLRMYSMSGYAQLCHSPQLPIQKRNKVLSLHLEKIGQKEYHKDKTYLRLLKSSYLQC